jgi:hypothetical protein
MSAHAGFYEFYRATDEDHDFPWINTRRPRISSIIEDIHVGSSSAATPIEPELELPRIPRTRRITTPEPLHISDDDMDMDEDWVDDRFGMSDDEEIDLTENNEITCYNNEEILTDNEL